MDEGKLLCDCATLHAVAIVTQAHNFRSSHGSASFNYYNTVHILHNSASNNANFVPKSDFTLALICVICSQIDSKETPNRTEEDDKTSDNK